MMVCRWFLFQKQFGHEQKRLYLTIILREGVNPNAKETGYWYNFEVSSQCVSQKGRQADKAEFKVPKSSNGSHL